MKARIKFPVIEDVSQWTVGITGRAILLSAKPIKPAVIDYRYPAPTHCRVQGVLLGNGRPIELIIPLPALHSLRANQRTFTEDEQGGNVPSGAILDYLGRIANHRKIEV